MKSQGMFICGSLFGMLAVILGAIGSHAFKEILETNQRTGSWALAVNFQLFHALLLLFISSQVKDQKSWAGLLVVAGIFLFCGSVYAVSLTGIKKAAILAPFGGVCLIAAWIVLLLEYWFRKS